MRCNGRRDCSLTRNVFNLRCGSGNSQHVNFIDIMYLCLKGKSTICTFYDSAFRVYFMICSCRSSTNSKYWLLSRHKFTERNYKERRSRRCKTGSMLYCPIVAERVPTLHAGVNSRPQLTCHILPGPVILMPLGNDGFAGIPQHSPNFDIQGFVCPRRRPAPTLAQ